MDNEVKVCKCGNKNCLGFKLLHEKEVEQLHNIITSISIEYGFNVQFDLLDSPSSGEIFTKFYELHVRRKNIEGVEVHG